jgi:hypothetical protein
MTIEQTFELEAGQYVGVNGWQTTAGYLYADCTFKIIRKGMICDE